MTTKADQQTIDQIAEILATPEWDVEMLEWIADAIGRVRPHPGGYAEVADYAEVFKAAAGRDLPNTTDWEV